MSWQTEVYPVWLPAPPAAVGKVTISSLRLLVDPVHTDCCVHKSTTYQHLVVAGLGTDLGMLSDKISNNSTTC